MLAITKTLRSLLQAIDPLTILVLLVMLILAEMGILDLVFPKKCLGCGGEGGYVCGVCLKALKRAKPVCPMCSGYSFGGKTHISCGRRWGMDGIVSVYEYEGLMRKLMLKLKYNFASEIAGEMGSLVVSELKRTKAFEGNKVVLVPVPLYRLRQRWRGFNQAAELGKVVVRGMRWNYAEIIERRANTASQTGFDKEERGKNVKNAFRLDSNIVSRNGSDIFYCSVSRPAERDYYENTSLITSKHGLKSSKIVIFDDVWTTGATMRECAKVLKRNGANEVWGLSVAG